MKADSALVDYVYEATSYGGYHDPNVVVIHDVEAPIEDGYAQTLIGPAWFGGPAGTSTHYIVGPDKTCQGVPENRIAWHCGRGNPRTLAIEQCGYARFSLAKWNSPKGLRQQDKVSRLLADINRRRPLIRLRTLSDAELLYAWSNPGSQGGISTHNQFRRVIGGTTHYDPFNAPDASVAYPLANVIAKAVSYRNGEDPTPKDWFDMATEEQLRKLIREEIANKIPSPSDIWNTMINSEYDGQAYRAWQFISAMDNRITRMPNQVYQENITSEVDGQAYKFWQYVASFDRRLSAIEAALKVADDTSKS